MKAAKMKIFNKSIRVFIHISFILGCISMVISVLITSANIIFRLFGFVLNGGVEIVVNLNVLIAFLVFGVCAMEDGHIKVDLIKKWPVLDHFCSIITLIFIAMFGYCAITQGLIVKGLGLQSAVVRMARWPFYMATALGYFSTTIALIGKEVNSFVNWIISRNGSTKALEK